MKETDLFMNKQYMKGVPKWYKSYMISNAILKARKRDTIFTVRRTETIKNPRWIIRLSCDRQWTRTWYKGDNYLSPSTLKSHPFFVLPPFRSLKFKTTQSKGYDVLHCLRICQKTSRSLFIICILSGWSALILIVNLLLPQQSDRSWM